MKHFLGLVILFSILTTSCERYVPDTLTNEDQATRAKDSTKYEELLLMRSTLITKRDSIYKLTDLKNESTLVVDSTFINSCTPTHFKGSISFYSKSISHAIKNNESNLINKLLVIAVKRDVNNLDSADISDTLTYVGENINKNKIIKSKIINNVVDEVYFFNLKNGIHKAKFSSIETNLGNINLETGNEISIISSTYSASITYLDSVKKSIIFYQEKWPKGFKSK